MTFLIIDIGSSSVRALLVTPDIQVMEGAIVSRAHDFQTDTDGRATADAPTLQGLVEACVDDILQDPRAGDIQAVGMATFVGNGVGLDADSQAITPLMSYADTRSHDDIPLLLEKIKGDSESYHQETGCMLHTAYLPAQLHWLQRTQPDVYESLGAWVDFGTYLYRQWFGRAIPMSYTVCAWSGLLNTGKLAWHEGYIQKFGLEKMLDCLPELQDYDTVQTGLAPTFAQRWQVLKDVPFFLAMGDGAVANVGSGAVDSQHMALTIGTTSALRIVKEIDHIPSGLWRYVICEDMPLVGGATSEGGNIYQWGVEQLGIAPQEINQALANLIPDKHGLTVLPLIAGERSPGWHSDASGTIHGIRRGTSRMELLQASLEAVAIRLSLIAGLLMDEDTQIMAGGGAIQASLAWAQMIADAFNRPISILDEAEITARGVAMMMQHALGRGHYTDYPPKTRIVLEPNMRHVPIYEAARQRQIALYERLY